MGEEKLERRSLRRSSARLRQHGSERRSEIDLSRPGQTRSGESSDGLGDGGNVEPRSTRGGILALAATEPSRGPDFRGPAASQAQRSADTNRRRNRVDAEKVAGQPIQTWC